MFKLLVGGAEYSFNYRPWSFGGVCYEARRQWSFAALEAGLAGDWSTI
jgi:hypothetical protein